MTLIPVYFILLLSKRDATEAVHKASELGLAPKVFITENKAEYLITEFVQGKIISTEEIHRPDKS